MRLISFYSMLLMTAFIIGCQPHSDSDTKDKLSEQTISVENPIMVTKHTDATMTYPHEFTRLSALPQPAPMAKVLPTTIEHHGLSVDDPYAWLRDQEYPTVNDQPVLDYLNEENAYFQTFKASQQSLIDNLFEEYKGRIDPNDATIPAPYKGYEYWSEYQTGKDYPLIMRRNLQDGGEQILLDLPALAQQYEYFVMGDYEISPDNKRIAYTVDTTGEERYSLFIKNLLTGETTQLNEAAIRENITFSADGNSIVINKLAPNRWYTESINVLSVTGDQEERVLLAESDEAFFLGHYVTSDEQHLVLSSGRPEMTEVHVLPMDNLQQSPVQLVSREQEMEASVDHAFGQFYILTNDTHVNYRIATVSSEQPDYNNWRTLLSGNESLYLRSIKLFEQGMIVLQSNNGLQQAMFYPKGNIEDGQALAFSESVYRVGLGTNLDFAATSVRVTYESMVTPDTLFDVSFTDLSKSVLKEKRIPSGYDSNDYITQRLMAPSRDGTAQIPVSIVYHKDYVKDGSAPLMLYAYGAYGYGMPPTFSTTRISLLDRGFAFAIAHTRGGDEMGYQWYLDGKLEKRQNAFNDFIDVAQYLIDENYVQAGNISALGGSAGGKMMGAVVTQAPHLWRSVVLAVPFVDVLNTMLDATLPLTPPEWSEWGNPIEDKDAFIRILDYSPYDNIESRDYPPMMVTGGLNDPRVTYWEPAKWTARMRAQKTDNNLLVMRMNMSAGHYANSGRYARLLDTAEEYAFILAAHGITE